MQGGEERGRRREGGEGGERIRQVEGEGGGAEPWWGPLQQRSDQFCVSPAMLKDAWAAVWPRCRATLLGCTDSCLKGVWLLSTCPCGQAAPRWQVYLLSLGCLCHSLPGPEGGAGLSWRLLLLGLISTCPLGFLPLGWYMPILPMARCWSCDSSHPAVGCKHGFRPSIQKDVVYRHRFCAQLRWC